MKPTNIAMALRAAYLSLHRQTNLYLIKHNVTADQFVCLAILNEEDGITQRELSTRAMSDPNTISAMLVLLENQKLITREDHPGDKRAKKVFLTKKGTSILEELIKELKPVRDKMITALTENETVKTIDSLTKIINAMSLITI